LEKIHSKTKVGLSLDRQQRLGWAKIIEGLMISGVPSEVARR
jgi:hypothetical protein